MPHFTLQVGPGGPELVAVLGVSQPRADALKKLGQPVPSVVNIRALVDTGASGTCIDPVALASLGLSPTGSTLVLTPTTGATPQPAAQYDISLYVYGKLTEPPLYIPSLPVTESILAVQGIQGLIGRDVLSRCLLMYNGEIGWFTLAF